ncbi:rab-GTPase-TBC domain-containing protein [Baffinella frigidus]|nr:rab-GTPase-TBC domain-containing protein [Cryptophyta sp. CCMP2293]
MLPPDVVDLPQEKEEKPALVFTTFTGPRVLSGQGPHGQWEIVQVLTPELANKLVLNRGAIFHKYSFTKGRVGLTVSDKAPRLVWISNDTAIKRIMWQEAEDTAEREFWFEQLSEHVKVARYEASERLRNERLVQRDSSLADRRKQWEEILPDFERKRKSAQCLNLCWRGIPTNLRVHVWQKCIGNQLRITQGMYDIFRQHARVAREKMEAEGESADGGGNDHLLGSEGSLRIVDKDLPRTFAELGFFHEGGPLEAQLRDVLEAYVFYRPDVGYVQGMSYLAAMLLLSMDTFQAFVALANLLHSHYFLSFFSMDMHEVRVRFSVFEILLERQLPDLYHTFFQLGVTTDVYLLNWLMTLFAKSLPIDITSRIWDNYLMCGESFMIRTALGVLKWLSAQFVDQPFEDLMVILTHLHTQEDIDEDELFECIASIKVTEEDFASVLEAEKEAWAAGRGKLGLSGEAMDDSPNGA